MYLKLAWRNIWRNKRRTWITVAAIAFAVFFSSLMKSAQLGSYERMIENVARFYMGYAQIQAKDYWEEKTLDYSFESSDELLSTARNAEHVLEAVPRIESFALASSENLTKGSLILGIDPEREHSLSGLKEKLVDGEYLTDSDRAVMLGKGLADYLKLGVGDTIVLISSGYHGVNAAGKYPIKGILKFPTPQLNKQVVYLPLKEAQWFYGAEKRLTAIAMIVEEADLTDQTLIDLESKLDTAVYEMMGWRELMPELIQQIELDYVGGLIMSYILYAVIAFGIFGTFLMMVNERKYEFGIIMAVGMKRFRLQFVVFLESIMIAFTGIITGMMMSLPIIVYFYYNPIRFGGEYEAVFESYGLEPIMPFSMEPSVFTSQAIAVLVITLILAMYPIWAILKLKINQAIRA